MRLPNYILFALIFCFFNFGLMDAQTDSDSVSITNITENSITIIPKAIRYVSAIHTGRRAFLTSRYLLLSINRNTFVSSAESRMFSTNAMHSAVITGRKTDITVPKRDKTRSKFCRAVKAITPNRIIKRIFFMFFEFSSILLSNHIKISVTHICTTDIIHC